MKNLITYFAKQHTLVNIITVFVLLAGIVSMLFLKRETFPEASMEQITITTIFPNTSALTVESLITNPLEGKLRAVEGVKIMSSYSMEGRSFIILDLDPGQVTVEKAKSDVLDIIDSYSDLPENAKKPVATVAESMSNFLIEMAVATNGDLNNFQKDAKDFQRFIEKLAPIASVSERGMPKTEIRVEALVQKMQRFEVTLTDLINALKNAHLDIPGGNVTMENGEAKDFVVKTVSFADNPESIQEVIIRSNLSGQFVRVKDVANVTWEVQKEEVLYRTNQKKSVNFFVFKKKSADTIQAVKQLRSAVSEYLSKKSHQLQVEYSNDLSVYVSRRLNVLSSNLLIGLIFVIGILSLMLPWRMALVASVGIPFSFLVTILIFDLSGISLNLLSMMGLIIVLGMLVDDAIVVTENAQNYLDQGMDAESAGIKGASEMWQPVTTSVITTIAAFAPLMFIPGIFGKFIKHLPVGVILALLISLLECFFILPCHISSWMKNARNTSKKDNWFNRYVTSSYLLLLNLSLRYKYYFASLTLAALVGSIIFAIKWMPFKLFPGVEADNFAITFETPMGSPLSLTEELTKKIETLVMENTKGNLNAVVSTVGLQSTTGMPAFTEQRGSNFGKVDVYLRPAQDRQLTLDQVIGILKGMIKDLPHMVKINFDKGRAGPPVGKAVNLQVLGDNFAEIIPAVAEVKKFLTEIPGVVDIQDSYLQGKEEILVKINNEKASLAAVNKLDIAHSVRAIYDGVVVDKIKQLDEEIEVLVTLPATEKNTFKSLLSTKIPNRQGTLIALADVATIENRQNVAVIQHEAATRLVQVVAEVESSKTSSPQVNQKLRQLLPTLQTQHPKVKFAFAGEEKDAKESVNDLKRTFIFALVGIFLLLVLQFNNLFQPLIVVAMIPLGVIACIWTFYFHSMPLSFLGLIGIIALSGVIVNNAIILIDQNNKYRLEGISPQESIIMAGRSRIRPIFLTTATTVVGILPTAYGIGGSDPFVVPIALALGWGMLVGGFLTTLVLPVILSIIAGSGNQGRVR